MFSRVIDQVVSNVFVQLQGFLIKRHSTLSICDFAQGFYCKKKMIQGITLVQHDLHHFRFDKSKHRLVNSKNCLVKLVN